jgi:hypothetical protein
MIRIKATAFLTPSKKSFCRSGDDSSGTEELSSSLLCMGLMLSVLGRKNVANVAADKNPIPMYTANQFP